MKAGGKNATIILKGGKITIVTMGWHHAFNEKSCWGALVWSGAEVEKRLFKVSSGGGASSGGRFLKPVLVLFLCARILSLNMVGVCVCVSVSFG